MSKTTDVIVVGSGMAGLTAALAAASRNCAVRVISEGMGCLAISGDSIDVLGYDNEGNILKNPYDGFANLAPEHPYSLLGVDNVRDALAEMTECLKSKGLHLQSLLDEHDAPRNFSIPTIVGTLKPTFFFQGNIDPAVVQKAERILVITVKGFRDCKPRLIINQLRRYPEWADKDFMPLVLPAPFAEGGRSLNALDLAHVADRKHGRDWILNTLKNKGKGFDLALVPPFMGSEAKAEIRDMAANALGCPYLEMLSVPPGVGGLRIRDALVRRLHELGVEFFENARVLKGEIRDGKCSAITVNATGREVTHHAKSFVLATGGILGGGVITEPGNVHEAIFGLNIPVPANVDEWSEKEIFGKHLFTRLGVKVDADLRPLDSSGAPAIENVFFAGRTLGGYDYASEKSGFGVAASTGWKAGCMAASLVAEKTGDNSATGEVK